MPPTSKPQSKRRRPSVDDFAEFLNDTYRDVLEACTTREWVAHFVYGPAAHTLVVYDLLGGPVEVTDAGRPLPDSPADVHEWLLVSRVGTTTLSATASPTQLANAVAVLMAASR